MVKYTQGDIIKIDFNPQKGHEQAGFRPAVIVSNNIFNDKTGMALVCPITNTRNNFPLHIELTDELSTTGVIECEHVRSLDVNSRGFKIVEKLSQNLLDRVLAVVKCQF